MMIAKMIHLDGRIFSPFLGDLTFSFFAMESPLHMGAHRAVHPAFQVITFQE
jgi:hypothetical protein